MSTTPLMQMDLPTVGVDSGTVGNNKYVAAFNVIDSHDHTSTKGTQVPTAGININSALSFNSFSGTNFRSSNFASQGAVFSSSSDNRSVYVVGNELYFRDGAGNNVQLTSSGSVAGTSGSIGGLSSPAVASFSTNTFIWKSDATTFAKMRNADIELYPATAAASNAITLKSPALSGSYTLTLPSAVPGSNQFLQMDTSGNVTTVTADTIGTAMTSTGANAIAADRTRATGTSVAAGGVAISASCGAYSTSSGTTVDVTNLSVTITTSGRPVAITLIPDESTAGSDASYIQGNTTTGVVLFKLRIVRDSTTIYQSAITHQNDASGPTLYVGVPPGALFHIDPVASGTYVYKIQAENDIGSLVRVNNCKLVAYEL